MPDHPASTPAELRALFPATKRASYLNAAASSPLALPVEQAVSEQLRESIEWGDVGFRGWLKRKEEIRKRLARFLGARGPEELAFLPSTSVGFSAVAHMLRQLGVREVLTLEGEFPSTTVPLLNQGLRLRVVPPREDGTYAVEDLERGLRKTTGALLVSAVQYATGFRIDLEAVRALCRSRRLLFAVNAAQALGQVPLDVEALDVDFLCAPSHKWMMGGYGAGLLYARTEHLERTRPLFSGWLSVADPMAMASLPGATISGRSHGKKKPRAYTARGTALRHDASVLEAGGIAWGPIFGLGAAAELLERVGLPRIAEHNAALQARLRQKLRSAGFVPTTPDTPGLTAGICVFPVKGRSDEAARELNKRGVVTTPRGGGVRASTHIFNNEEDVDQLLWALAKAEIPPPG